MFELMIHSLTCFLPVACNLLFHPNLWEKSLQFYDTPNQSHTGQLPIRFRRHPTAKEYSQASHLCHHINVDLNVTSRFTSTR